MVVAMELAYKARIATFKDIQSIVNILKPILNQKGIGGELKRHIKGIDYGVSLVRVLEFGGKIVGFLALARSEKKKLGFITYGYIEPNHRNKANVKWILSVTKGFFRGMKIKTHLPKESIQENIRGHIRATLGSNNYNFYFKR